MTIDEIAKLTMAKVVTDRHNVMHGFEKAASSDLMSDVLTLDEDNVLLITGLTNLQIIRTSEMADIHAILLTRDKKASPEMIKLANESQITILETPFSLFRASGILFQNGLKPSY